MNSTTGFLLLPGGGRGEREEFWPADRKRKSLLSRYWFPRARAQRTAKRRSSLLYRGGKRQFENAIIRLTYRCPCHLSRNRKPPQIENQKKEGRGGEERKREITLKGGREKEREATLHFSHSPVRPDVTIARTRKNNLKAENNGRSLDGICQVEKRVHRSSFVLSMERHGHCHRGSCFRHGFFSLIMIGRPRPRMVNWIHVKQPRIVFLAPVTRRWFLIPARFVRDGFGNWNFSRGKLTWRLERRVTGRNIVLQDDYVTMDISIVARVYLYFNPEMPRRDLFIGYKSCLTFFRITSQLWYIRSRGYRWIFRIFHVKIAILELL